MELSNSCFQELIVMQTANQALCSLNRISTDKTVLGNKKKKKKKNAAIIYISCTIITASNGVSLTRVKTSLLRVSYTS